MIVDVFPVLAGMRYPKAVRARSYGQQLTALDHVGQRLSAFRILRLSKKLKKRGILLDIGSGYNATLSKPLWKHFSSIYLFDVDIDENLARKSEPSIYLVKGELPTSLINITIKNADLVIANNILEHLSEPNLVLEKIRKILSKTSIVYINVPSWRGKYFLELAAFRFNLAPQEEMQDHKNYYDKKELWTLVRSAGFLPSEIKVKHTKFGLNTTCWITNGK